MSRQPRIISKPSGCISWSEGCDEQENLQVQEDQQQTSVHDWWTVELEMHMADYILGVNQPAKKKQQQDATDLHHQKDVR